MVAAAQTRAGRRKGRRHVDDDVVVIGLGPAGQHLAKELAEGWSGRRRRRAASGRR